MAANKDKEKDLETTEETITTEVDKPAKRLKRVPVKNLLRERVRKRAIKSKFPKKNGKPRF